MARISMQPVHVGPSQFATPEALRNEFKGVVNQSAKVVEADYRRTFRTWNHKPRVRVERIQPSEVLVGIDRSDENGRIWGYVNDGTVPHEIRPVRARRLRFFTGGTAKTRRGVIASGPGSPATDGPNFADVVQHPGFEGRDFEGQIAEKNEELVADLTAAALARLAR